MFSINKYIVTKNFNPPITNPMERKEEIKNKYRLVFDEPKPNGIDLVYSFVAKKVVTFTDPRFFSEGTYCKVEKIEEPLSLEVSGGEKTAFKDKLALAFNCISDKDYDKASKIIEDLIQSPSPNVEKRAEEMDYIKEGDYFKYGNSIHKAGKGTDKYVVFPENSGIGLSQTICSKINAPSPSLSEERIVEIRKEIENLLGVDIRSEKTKEDFKTIVQSYLTPKVMSDEKKSD